MKWLDARSCDMKDTDRNLKCRSCLGLRASALKTCSTSSCDPLAPNAALGGGSEREQ